MVEDRDGFRGKRTLSNTINVQSLVFMFMKPPNTMNDAVYVSCKSLTPQVALYIYYSRMSGQQGHGSNHVILG